MWTSEHEIRLREHVSRLKAERSVVQGTCVTLESMQVENMPLRSSCTQEARKMDLEMAVLMQVNVCPSEHLVCYGKWKEYFHVGGAANESWYTVV